MMEHTQSSFKRQQTDEAQETSAPVMWLRENVMGLSLDDDQAARPRIWVEGDGTIIVRARNVAVAAFMMCVLIGLFVYQYFHHHINHHMYLSGLEFSLCVLLTAFGFFLLLATTAATVPGTGGMCMPAGGCSDALYSDGVLTPTVRLLLCGVGITFSFLFYGYVLESLTDGGKKLPEVVAILMNSVTYVAVARAALFLQGKAPTPVSAKYFFAIALSSKTATFLTWRALRYVSFPTQVLAKSCKAIPIMTLNYMFGKRYKCMQYVSIGMITSGVAIFMIKPGESRADAKTETLGMVLLFFALVCDGLTGALEDKAIHVMEWKHGDGTFDLMLNINLYALPICFGYLFLSGEVLHLGDITGQQMFAMTWLSLAGAMGQMCIFYTIANFGALSCSVITTVRKVLQIFLSALAFGHVFTTQQDFGLGVTFIGLCVNINEKRKPRTPSQRGGGAAAVVKPPNYNDNFIAATRSSV